MVFLAVSAGLDLVLSLIAAIRLQEIDDQALLIALSVAADGYFLVYIFAARRVRDTFSEFPPPESAEVR